MVVSLQAEAGATVLFTLDGALESVLQQCAGCCIVLQCVEAVSCFHFVAS